VLAEEVLESENRVIYFVFAKKRVSVLRRSFAKNDILRNCLWDGLVAFWSECLGLDLYVEGIRRILWIWKVWPLLRQSISDGDRLRLSILQTAWDRLPKWEREGEGGLVDADPVI
jgi:hypothetical protein